ncbi:hypothetical protein NDU88_000621 [Pleurodeles waltl]|uniref:Acid-sensing ion channel 4 n=1 Tax=Pleurodeles waltl TaxID=8319 RepID=A0AAV7U4I3_PLEWA|nr:hypothetical protein NDU88_000621 [Pleurodeles waltl]
MRAPVSAASFLRTRTSVRSRRALGGTVCTGGAVQPEVFPTLSSHREHEGPWRRERRPGPPRPRDYGPPGVPPRGPMPIEIVCKIKFAEEEDEKRRQEEEEEGEKESLIEGGHQPPLRDLAAFARTSTLHGLCHIFRSGSVGIKQTLWALAFLSSLVFFLYQAAKCALFYLEHPHVTALDEEAAREMAFPAVTICNINRFRHSALTDADIYHLANMTGLPPKDRDGHRATDLVYPEPDMQDIVNRTGHQLSEMLKSCNFSGDSCSSQNFTVVSQTRFVLTMTAHDGWSAARHLLLLDLC